MGEEVVWSTEEELDARAESEMEVEVEEEEEEVETGDDTEKKEKKRKRKKNRGRSSSGVVRWEKFLKRMTMRVLLVEADDSTRQIIAALLRKCSYRVAAVSDGLKAWEILKGRPHSIDLILTEVDLPSISGYALLTLMMEHEICKNIPVIMMSTQDSVSTVYKCMLKGAADYLVKPIRRNELRNLWQHVWRRQSQLNVDANNHQDESVGQQEVDANSEDNAASNHSSRQMAGRQGSDEHVENGSDTQSSCTRPELEVEKSPKETLQEFSESNWGKLVPSDVVSQKGDACINMGPKMFVHEIGAGGTIVDTSKDDITARLSKDKPETQEDANATNEACDSNYVFANSSREAMDLIGAFHNHPNSGRRGTGIGEFDSFPQLDLSLKRSHPCGFWTESPEERRTLGHSNSSAFTRYTSRPLQPPQTKVVNLKENGTTSEKLLSNIVSDYSSDTNGMTRSTQRSVVTLAQCQSKESEVATSCSQLRVFPVPVPVKGVRVNNLCSGYGSVLPPIFCTPSGPLPTPSPSSFALQEPSFQVKMFYQSNVDNSNFDQHHDPHSQNTNSVKQTTSKQEHKLDSLEDRGHISPATDQSASSSFCNGGVNCYSNIGYGSACGSNSNVDNVPFYGAASENKNEEGLLTPTGSSHRSTQREAALTKFRLKRKERCYEKKVRYESRKKLAEQRPRIKGQFVRQVHTDPPTAETYGNSFDG